LSTLIGPAVAGALIAQVGLSAPFFFNAASFLAILGALMVIRVPPPRARAAAGLRADTSEGITYVLRHPVLPAIFLAEIAVNIFGHNSALITIYAREVLHTDATGLGLMLSAIGAGALCGVFALIAIGDVRRKGWLLLIGGMTYSLTLAAFGVSRDLTIAVAVLAVLGVADSMWGAMRNTILQTAIDDNYRGRVMSLSIITTRGFTSISQVQTGVSVSIVGPQGAALIGASLIAGTIMWTLRSKGLRRYESVPQTGPALGSGS
jgi:predicted MFS family arabinose efflux permease